MEYATENQSFLDEDTFRLSFDSEGEEAPAEPWYSLIRNSTTDQIQSLHTIFKEKELKKKLNKSSESEGLTKQEFVNAVDEVFGIGRFSVQATYLFDAIEKENEREVNWTNFVDFLIKNLIPAPQSKLLLGNPEIFAVPHVKRETVVKIVSIEKENYFCYAVISKHGHVGVYNGNMDFLTSYHVVMTREDIPKNDEDRRKRNRWVTDAFFCKDAGTLLITNTTRSISIYEASGIKHILLWLVLSLPNVIQCLWYHANGSNTNGKSVLLMGDDQGRVTSLTFLQSKIEQFRKKHNDKPSVFYWLELPAEKQHVSIKYHGKVHSDFVRQIQYVPENGSVITCSRDRTISLANKHIANRREAYLFKMNRGAECFTLSNSAKHVITGSSDGTIRFWDIVIPARPITVLLGHRAGIVDLRCFDDQEAFISCSRDANIRVWDTRTYNCVQTIKWNHSVLNNFGKSIEWAFTCIYLGPKRTKSDEKGLDQQQLKKTDSTSVRSHLLVTCCNYIARIKLNYPNNSEIECELEMPILPPPPLQNSVLIPSTWKIHDDNITVETNPFPHDEKIENHIKSLTFILEKDLMADYYDYNEDINYKIAVLERKKLEMKESVAIGAPFLALDLFEIEDVTLPADLPVPKKKSVQTLVEKTQKMLTDAANRNQIFSEPSSSRSKSSRSSVMEFEY